MITLDVIRNCLEGFFPAVMATVDPEGVPNVSLISQVHYVDPDRVAVSYQFFNKTRRNVLATGTASVLVADPVTMAEYRLTLDYEGTEAEGPVFESMKAKLAGIASHTGMQGVFRLLGSDVYRVRAIEAVAPPLVAPPPMPRNLLSATRRTCEALAAACELGELIDRTLDCLEREFGAAHSMVLMLDRTARRLYTVASRGYPQSGVGSEIALGEGVIGVAAREGVPIRIGHMTAEDEYGSAIRASARAAGSDAAAARRIPYPGLRRPQSQLALPIRCAGEVVGVLFVESHEPMRFWYDDEDALATVAGCLGAASALLRQAEEAAAPAEASAPGEVAAERPLVVRHYRADDSVFFDTTYIIKGVAGAILWKLVREYVGRGRVDFTNRELRLDPGLRLPEHAENLEARLVLLHKRLAERDGGIRIEKSGRGRFRLAVACRPVLEEIAAGEGASAA